jgi:hypothetical protein
MPSALLTVEGMIRGRGTLAIEHLLHHVDLDDDGRLLVAMIDVLALVRIETDAELVLVRSHDGGSCALRVARIVDCADVFLELRVSEPSVLDCTPWTVHLWSPDAGASSPVASIQAMSFSSFVGSA